MIECWHAQTEERPISPSLQVRPGNLGPLLNDGYLEQMIMLMFLTTDAFLFMSVQKESVFNIFGSGAAGAGERFVLSNVLKAYIVL